MSYLQAIQDDLHMVREHVMMARGEILRSKLSSLLESHVKRKETKAVGGVLGLPQN